MRRVTPFLFLILLPLLAADSPTTQPATILAPKADVFRKSSHVSAKIEGKFLVVRSDGIPDHSTGPFPNANNPNSIRKQHYVFKIPLEPKIADHVTKTPMGPIGVAINGVPFYNQFNAQMQDAAKLEVFDDCCGHPDQAGRYHYHIYPKCVHTSFKDPAGEHSPLIGYMFDGIAIYGPNGEDGKPPTDLDECNGHSDPVRGYHYHVTAKYPYLIGGYRGVVEMSNIDHPPDGAGPATRPQGPPPSGIPPRGPPRPRLPR